MHPLAITLAALVALLVAATPAEGARYTCKAAKDLSKLGVSDNATVVVDPDDAKRECRFSVNGEPAGSPPRDAIIKALGVLQPGTAVARLQENDVEWLGLLLLAASRDTAVSSTLRERLKANAAPLAKCLSGFAVNPRQVSAVADSNVVCRVLASGEQIDFGGQHAVVMESEAPHLVIGVRRSPSEASFLFIPDIRLRPR